MIDEKKLIKDIKGWQEDIRDNEYDAKKYDFAFERIYEMVEEQPRVGEWIPCSDRLPEKSGKYLGQRPHGDIIDIEFSKKHQKWNAHDSRPPKYAIEVIAWMPLPEPYKEDADGEDD